MVRGCEGASRRRDGEGRRKGLFRVEVVVSEDTQEKCTREDSPIADGGDELREQPNGAATLMDGRYNDLTSLII